MAPLRYVAKFDPFLSLDCAPTPSILAQSKERKGSNFAIWQPCLKEREVVNSISSVEGAMAEVLEDPKTLMYGHHGVIGPFSNIDRELRSQFQTLNIDDGSWMLTTLALQKDSEFLQVRMDIFAPRVADSSPHYDLSLEYSRASWTHNIMEFYMFFKVFDHVPLHLM